MGPRTKPWAEKKEPDQMPGVSWEKRLMNEEAVSIDSAVKGSRKMG